MFTSLKLAGYAYCSKSCLFFKNKQTNKQTHTHLKKFELTMRSWIKVRFKGQIFIMKVVATNSDNKQYAIKFSSMTSLLWNHFSSFLIKFNLEQRVYKVNQVLWWKENKSSTTKCVILFICLANWYLFT